MGQFVKGDVVVTYFPYSDLSDKKKRPALVLAAFPESSVLLLAQITSRDKSDEFVVELDRTDFESGALRVDSFIRTNFLFTSDEELPLYTAGRLKPEKVEQVITRVVAVLTRK